MCSALRDVLRQNKGATDLLPRPFPSCYPCYFWGVDPELSGVELGVLEGAVVVVVVLSVSDVVVAGFLWWCFFFAEVDWSPLIPELSVLLAELSLLLEELSALPLIEPVLDFWVSGTLDCEGVCCESVVVVDDCVL